MNIDLNLDQLLIQGATSFHWLNFAQQSHVLHEIDTHTFVEAPAVYGVTKQCFLESRLDPVCAPRTASYLNILEEYLCDTLREVIPKSFCFNEHNIHRYPITDLGLGIHRDFRRYEGIIVITVLDDGGSFYVYDTEKNEETRRLIYTERGHCIVMKGYNFCNSGISDSRVPHMVERVTYPRITIGSRYNRTLSSAV